jgi:DNA-nicking Smr family endonuclease
VNDDDADLFRKVVADAKPLKRRRPAVKPAAPAPVRSTKPKPAAKKKPAAPLSVAAPAAPAKPRPRAIAPGEFADIDRRTADRFRRGKLAIEARLDLHGHYQEDAHAALNRFIPGCAATGKRCVLVITGRGSREGSGVLRARLPEWLNAPPCRAHVLAVAPAQPQHGGAGAFYVLLKRQRDAREGGRT